MDSTRSSFSPVTGCGALVVRIDPRSWSELSICVIGRRGIMQRHKETMMDFSDARFSIQQPPFAFPALLS
eukprot:scaffold91683_cov52-Attheya_sp.AAC.2